MSHRQWPTLADETIRAREELTLAQSIAMALRSHRGTLGEAQRDYAARRGWSAAHQARLEQDPDNHKLRQVVEALDGTEFRLALLGAQSGGESAPESWPTSELLARDAAGRRLPRTRSPTGCGACRAGNRQARLLGTVAGLELAPGVGLRSCTAARAASGAPCRHGALLHRHAAVPTPAVP